MVKPDGVQRGLVCLYILFHSPKKKIVKAIYGFYLLEFLVKCVVDRILIF